MSLLQKLKASIYCYKHPGKGISDTYAKFPKGFKFDGEKVLNLGCGTSVYPVSNVINLDKFDADEINCVWDLNKVPLPFADNTFDLIIANHILEHIPNWFECFKECARILKPGGLLEVWVPGDGNSSQLGYRDHINVINFYSFYGISGTLRIRNHCNLWELEERKHLGQVVKLQLHHLSDRVFQYWWLQLLPDRLLQFCKMHLRHVIAESGFIFIKQPDKGRQNSGIF